jgi:crotonobetaine/carnitine-CoA ligase
VVTAPGLLAELARQRGDDEWFVEAESGASFTYRAVHDGAQRFAVVLESVGIAEGDTVATMIPHSADTYRLWFGIALRRALEVPISTRYRGRMLEHILDDAKVRVLVVDGRFVPTISDAIEAGLLPNLETIIVRNAGSTPVSFDGVTTLRLGDLVDQADPVESVSAPSAHDTAMVLYTSGTTGPSKGVLVPWGQIHATVTGVFPAGTFDSPKVLYCPFPPNHIGGRLFPCLALLHGIPVVVRDTFSASQYWTDVRGHGCTTTALVPAMASILWNAPAAGDDLDNPLHDVAMVPIIPEYEGFRQRFGVRICTDYNMTEVSIPTVSGWSIDDWRSCGRVRTGSPGYEVRIVDEHDRPVPTGAVGELVCRTSEPWAMNAGYLGRPAETARAWRNGWFHTGDAFRVDEHDRYYFVDRIKDAIRRRGENVSSFEVEREIADHPDVVECAAIGVPSDLGEEDIKAFVVRREGSDLSAGELIEYLRQRCPDFMVPSYVEFIGALPRTDGTLKVKKAELRARASGAGTDGSVAGASVLT